MRKYRCSVMFQSGSDSIPKVRIWDYVNAETTEEARQLFCTMRRGYLRSIQRMHPFDYYIKVREVRT